MPQFRNRMDMPTARLSKFVGGWRLLVHCAVFLFLKTEDARRDSIDSRPRVDPETKNLLEKIRVKYPYLCSEILASQLGGVLDCVMDASNDFLDLLFEHIRNEPPLDAVLTNYWRTAVVALTRRDPSRIIQYFRNNTDVLDRLVQHISDQSIMEVSDAVVEHVCGRFQIT